jgi:tRNA (guanine-N7-)-methyltransferase
LPSSSKPLSEAEQRSRQRGNLYGRRKGPKLSARQAGLRRTLLQQLAFIPGGDLRTVFPNSVQDVWLEVGFGAGEHLAWQAEHHSDIGLIGAEPYEMGVAKLLTKLEENPPANVRIYEGDGREVIAGLPDASLGRFFLLFPDPWPKTRHQKRRFLQFAMLNELARVLKPGAELRFATDDKSYLPYALERLLAHPSFEWLAKGPRDWLSRPADWPPTRYETKAIKGPPVFFRFARKANVRP